MKPAANQESNRRTQLELREIERRAASGVRAKSDRRMRTLYRARHVSDERMANDYRGNLRPLAANLHQKRADIAVMRVMELVDGGDFERLFAAVATIHRVMVMAVMMMAVRPCIAIMLVCPGMLGRMRQMQTVMVPLIQRQPVQALPQQRHGTIRGQKAASHEFAAGSAHWTK
jgi:hypothetical protein